MSKKYNCIELFAGSGGLGTGFENAGFNIVCANDVWEPASKTYIANHPNVKYIVEDISKVTGEQLLYGTGYRNSDIDVIIGGPPCQGFSTLGKRFIDDPRNKLFREYVRIVGDIRPKFFVMENVSGILSMQGGKVLENILEEFKDIGYNLEYRLLNAVEYGVPQQRERIIFIGTNTKTRIKYPEPTHSFNGKKKLKVVTLWDAISDLPQSDEEEITKYLENPKNDYQKSIRKSCKEVTNHKPAIHNEKAKNMMKFIPTGLSAWNVKDKIPKEYMPTSGYGNTYARLNPNEPGMTITRNFSCISSSRCIHPYLNRGLTAREAARIQSYPDNYKFLGSKTDIRIQIGNSVPPLLSERIGIQIRNMLEHGEN
ncbi:MAG: DNA cytosine methyltransferase [Bacilli bacterium]